MIFEISETNFTNDLQNFVSKGFNEHAIENIGANDLSENIAFAIEDENKVIACIVVQLFWGQLHIKKLYVKEEYRKLGVGKKLMNRAFEYGIKHKCSFAFVETMSFQGVEFYQKLGFVIELKRCGYSYKTSFYYLKKDLI